MKKISFVDKETGEYFESTVAVIQPRRRNGFQSGGWAAMAQTALEYLAANRKVLGEEGFAVFMSLAAQMDMENYIQINQTKVGQALGMRQSNVNRAIRRLVDLGVVLQGPKVGRSRTYRLNPHVGWKGSAAKHREEVRRSAHLSLVSDAPGRDPDTKDMFD